MSSSATDTEGQITIAKSAEGVCAIRVNGDIGALEIYRTISRLDSLAAPCATLSGAYLSKRCGNFGLRQAAQAARIDLYIEAGGLDEYQRTGIANVSGDCAKRPAASRDGITVEPPLTAKIDGKAA